MKKIGLIGVFVLSFITVFSQNMMEERMAQEKVKYINEQLNLPDDKRADFWVVYTEFQEKRKDLRIEITQNRLGLRKSTLTEKEAKTIIDHELQLKKQMVDLEVQYVKKYEDVLSSIQIVELFNAEDDFNKVVMQRLRQMRQNEGNSPRKREGF